METDDDSTTAIVTRVLIFYHFFFVSPFSGLIQTPWKANAEEATVVDETPNGELEKCKSD